MRLEGKVCAVTGGASGLGEGAVKYLASEGCKVAILDLNAAKGEQLAQSLGPNVIFQNCNVTCDQSLAAAIVAIVAKFGRLDAMITSAGIVTPKQTLGKSGPHSLAAFEKTFSVNAIGTFNAARHAVGQFMKQEAVAGERGVIVMVSSVHAHDGTRGVVAYASTKGAIAGMTLPMARDLGALQIRVVTIMPGLFNTPMGQTLPAEPVIKVTPLGRLGDPLEFGEAVAFAIKSKFMTGCELRLDGGMRNPHL